MALAYPIDMTLTLTAGKILVYVRDDVRSRIIECENLPSSIYQGLVYWTKIHLPFKITFFSDHFLMKKNMCKYTIN